MKGYSYEFKEGETVAKARGKELHISPKHSMEICRALSGKKVESAKKYLESVIAKEQPVPFKRYVRCIPHKRGPGFGAGRYPVKAAKAILRVLSDAEANAEYSGLDTDNLVIRHIVADKGHTWKGWMPRAHGRSTAKDRESVNIEVIVSEAGE